MDKIKALLSYRPQKQLRSKKVFLATVILLLIVSAVVVVKMRKDRVASFKSITTKEAAKALTDTVGELITLPTDEEPAIATVSDKNQLGNQVFFANAENGDKVLIYQRSKKVILYRPSTGKIIAVAPLAEPTPIKEVVGASASAVLSPTHATPSKAISTPTPTLTSTPR